MLERKKVGKFRGYPSTAFEQYLCESKGKNDYNTKRNSKSGKDIMVKFLGAKK